MSFFILSSSLSETGLSLTQSFFFFICVCVYVLGSNRVTDE